MGISPLSMDVLAFAIRGWLKVMKSGECISACPSREGFETSFNMGTPPECIYCDSSLFLEMNHEKALGCTCKAHYYADANGDCQTCDDSLCKVCNDPGDTCTTCVMHAMMDGSNNCICKPGFYASNGECLKCPVACPTCTSATNCDSCS